MSAKYTVSTMIGFSASHSLSDYSGDCARIHGHNWGVRVYYEFESTDENGLTADFLELKGRLEGAVLPRFDHRHLNDIPPFDRVNPTSENLAAEIYRICRDEISFPRGRLAEVELWETETDMVRYSEDGVR